MFRNQLKRLKWARENATLVNKETLFEQAINNMILAYKGYDYVSEAWYEKAKILYDQSQNIDLKTANNTDKNKRVQAAKICEEVIKNLPNSFGAGQCKALLSDIQSKSLVILAEQVYLPMTKNKFLVSYKNCDTAYVTVLKYDPEENSNSEGIKKYMLKHEPVYTSEVRLTGTADFFTHSSEVLLPELEKGYYLLVVSSDKNIEKTKIGFTYTEFWVTQLAYQTKLNDSQVEIMALCRKTGHPLEDAEVKIKQSQYNRALKKYVEKTIGSYKSDKDGLVTSKNLERYKSYYISIKSGDDIYEPKRTFYHYGPRDRNRPKTEVNLFTDRKLYRPGQTIYYKGIVTAFDGKENQLKKNFSTVVKFLDVNYLEIKRVTVETNEFGSFEGKFVAPYGVLTGRMMIKAGSYGSTAIQVEEYKRPKFSALIHPLKGEYKLNDAITVKGMAEAFAGSKISDAAVKYRVQRTTRYNYWRWWYRPSPSKEVSNGETITNEKGEFSFDFKAIPDESVDPKTLPVFNYTVTVDVVDVNGETHSASKTFSLGYHSLILTNSIPDMVSSSQESEFEIKGADLNGELLEASGSYEISKLKAPRQTLRKRLWSSPDQHRWSEEEFKELFPGHSFENEMDHKEWEKEAVVQKGIFNTKTDDKFSLTGLQKWKTGRYKYTAVSKDKNGVEVKDEAYFMVYQPNAKKAIDNDVCQIIPLQKSIKPGHKAKFLVSTAEDHLNVFYSINFKGETIKQEWLHLKNEQALIDFDVEEAHIGKLVFDFIIIKNDRSYNNSFNITVPAPEHHLELSLASFRDKLLPGQDEEWTLIIKNAKNEKAQAELLATLYDASLDELVSKNSFNLSLIKPYYSNSSWQQPVGFGQASSSNSNYYWNRRVSMPYRSHPILNTFGYSANSYMGYDDIYYNMSSKSGGLLDLDAEPMMDEEAEFKKEAGNPKKSKSVVARYGNSFELDGGYGEGKPGEFGSSEVSKTPAESSGSEVAQPRTNFNETAFFYPQLHTNEQGEIQVKFTIPESLTKWRFLGLAHSKTLEIGTIEKELVTQKDLMVLPNIPRFFREGDQVTITTKISNITSDAINGAANLKLFDPFTEEEVTSQFLESQMEQSFTVNPEGNTKVSWTLTVPDNRSTVKYRISASSPKHTDGEENVVPILSNRMLVTESLPLPMSRAGSKSFTFKKLKDNKSTTLTHHQLTLEYTSNPAWYALQAMPYMMEYPYECAEQTFTRYYSNAIATHVLNSKPKIKAIIDQWRNESPQAFLSNLNKNEDLKALLLAETPWVLSANSESETKRNLAVLLDLNRMNGELEKALSKIVKMQSGSGGWPWFKGMRDNRYITQHIITGLGHLDVLGIKAIKENRKVKQMVNKGVRYLDREIVREFEKLKRLHDGSYLKNNYLGYSQIQYLYMRSYFPDKKMDEATKEAVNYYSGQAKKYWLEYNVYAKGMIGLAAKRMGMDDLANDIYKSLKDNAIMHDEFGMYWKSYTSGFYWYQAPIETQALMIEFFNEMEDMASVEALKMWLLKEKQTTHWKTTKQTSEAVYALLLNGIDLLETDNLVNITVGGKAIEYKEQVSSNPYIVKPEAGTGYFKTKWTNEEIDPKMATIKVTKNSSGPSWGAMYWQYFEQLDKITFAKTPLQLDKSLFKVILTDRGEQLEAISNQSPINIGDKIRVRIVLRSDRNLEYVHMKDMRASGFEPIDVISKYKYQGGLGYYQATKDAATNFFFDFIRKGTYVFEYDLRAEQLGDFSNGIATIQCMYAPEFTSHSDGIRVNIKSK